MKTVRYGSNYDTVRMSVLSTVLGSISGFSFYLMFPALFILSRKTDSLLLERCDKFENANLTILLLLASTTKEKT
jgi:hypothetical protein